LAKICFIAASSFNLKRRLPIMKRLLQLGHSVIGISTAGTEHEQMQKEGIKLYDFGFSRGGLNLFADYWHAKKLQAILQSEKPDIVHTFTIKPNIFGALAAKRAGVQTIIASVTGLGFDPSHRDFASLIKAKGLLLFTRWTAKYCKTVIVQNEGDKAHLQEKGIPESAFTLIPGSGVDTKRFTPPRLEARLASRKLLQLAEGEVCVLFVGRLLRAKGVGELLTAVQDLEADFLPKLSFFLVGGSDRESGGALNINELSAQKSHHSIRFFGEDLYIRKYFEAADIFCLPSYCEGLPGVNLEAMASGLPVITSDAPGCRITVLDGETGVIVPIKNSQAILQALKVLAKDKSMREKMGAAGRRRAEEMFSVERIAQMHVACYKEHTPGI